MTGNQIAYWNLVENQRANKAKEAENYRSNVAKETETNRSNLIKEGETNRSNLANEAISRDQLLEQKRNNDLNYETRKEANTVAAVNAGTKIVDSATKLAGLFVPGK